MQLLIKNKAKESIAISLRRAGYRFLGKGEEGDEMTFIRILGVSGYPRFHIYLRVDKLSQKIFLNLHLDQRKTIYKGAPAHSADYEGIAVEDEIERIKRALQESE